MTGIKPERRLGPPPAHIIETEIKGDISLYDAQSNQVLVLNATASDIWLLCDGEHTLEEVVGLLASAYGRAPEEIHPDIEATVVQLIDAGFIPPA